MRKRRMNGLKGAIKSLEKKLDSPMRLAKSESKMKVNLYKRILGHIGNVGSGSCNKGVSL